MEAADIEKRFSLNSLDENQQEWCYQIRTKAREFAEYINEYTTVDSREKSLAITALEECVFWANAAIARNS